MCIFWQSCFQKKSVVKYINIAMYSIDCTSKKVLENLGLASFVSYDYEIFSVEKAVFNVLEYKYTYICIYFCE